MVLKLPAVIKRELLISEKVPAYGTNQAAQ
jgi:hypothetical protein